MVTAYPHERITPGLQHTTEQPYQSDRQNIFCF